jgi:hypothetical protein
MCDGIGRKQVSRRAVHVGSWLWKRLTAVHVGKTGRPSVRGMKRAASRVERAPVEPCSVR